jgi:hypothetical protein
VYNWPIKEAGPDRALFLKKCPRFLNHDQRNGLRSRDFGSKATPGQPGRPTSSARIGPLSGEPETAQSADAVIPAVDAEAMEMGVAPAEGDLDDVRSWAMEHSLRTRIRRQIMGLIWRIQIWSL